MKTQNTQTKTIELIGKFKTATLNKHNIITLANYDTKTLKLEKVYMLHKNEVLQMVEEFNLK